MSLLEWLASRRTLELPSLRMSRRKLFSTGLAAAGTVVGAAALHTPGWLRPEDNGFDIFPGWIERDIQTPFMQFDKGHFYFLREAIDKNPVLLSLTRDFFAYLTTHLQSKQRVVLGDAINFVIVKAHEKLGEDISDLEALHAAVFPLAAGFTAQWFTKSELENFGANFSKPGSSEEYENWVDYYWDGNNGLATITYPKLFGLEKEEPKKEEVAKIKYGGQDRAIHFAHHFLIGFLYMYSQTYGLGIHESMPNIIKAAISVNNGTSVEDRARTMSERIGGLYEFLGLLKGLENWPINGRTPEAITDGPFDDTVEQDLKANALGVEAAIEFFKRAMAGLPLEPVFTELNNPRFSHAEASPRLLITHYES